MYSTYRRVGHRSLCLGARVTMGHVSGRRDTSRPLVRRQVAPSAILSSTAMVVRLAHRSALQQLLPGRLLMTAASRFCGTRVALVVLFCYSAAVTAWAAFRRPDFTDKSESKGDLSERHEHQHSYSCANSGSRCMGQSFVQPSLALEHSGQCPLCHGTGYVSWEAKWSHNDPCPRCLGKGWVSF
jgi:hypothetical protein